MEYLQSALDAADGFFFFDGGGMWLYGGWRNPYDNGERYGLLAQRYSELEAGAVPETGALAMPILIAAVLLPAALITARKGRKVNANERK